MTSAVCYFEHVSRTLAHNLALQHSHTLSRTAPTIKTQGNLLLIISKQKKEGDFAGYKVFLP